MCMAPRRDPQTFITLTLQRLATAFPDARVTLEADLATIRIAFSAERQIRVHTDRMLQVWQGGSPAEDVLATLVENIASSMNSEFRELAWQDVKDRCFATLDQVANIELRNAKEKDPARQPQHRMISQPWHISGIHETLYVDLPRTIVWISEAQRALWGISAAELWATARQNSLRLLHTTKFTRRELPVPYRPRPAIYNPQAQPCQFAPLVVNLAALANKIGSKTFMLHLPERDHLLIATNHDAALVRAFADTQAELIKNGGMLYPLLDRSVVVRIAGTHISITDASPSNGPTVVSAA